MLHRVLFGEDSKERCRRSPNRVKRNTASSGAVNATRSYSKRPSPSDTEYEIARVRGDALVRCSPRCKQRVVQVPPAKARRPSPAADSPKNTPGLTQPSAAKSQQPPTPPAPQETEDSMLGKHPRDDLSDTNDSDTSGAGATLLTTITPARQVRLIYIFHVAAHEI